MLQPGSFSHGRFALLLVGLAALIAPPGCDTSPRSSSAGPAKKVAVDLKLLVVGDLGMVEAARPLKAEWRARTGGSFDVHWMSPEEFAELKSLTDDAVIFPSGRLGTLAERGLIVPLSADQVKLPELRWTDVFETLQLREVTWAGQPHAVPFGSPLLVCWYRPDLLEKFNRRPPVTWREYQRLAEFFSHRENLLDAAPPADGPWYGTLEPTEASWGGRLLLARAAAYAKHRDSYSTFFNIDTMKPLIDGPPFERALVELAAAARVGSLELDPDGVRREFLDGHAAMALTWPTAADRKRSEPTKTPVGFVEMPGSEKVYSVATKRWEQRDRAEDPHMCFVGISGRLGAVSALTAHPDESLLLLGWLSSEWSKRVCVASRQTTVFRYSQLSSPESWVDAGIDLHAARSYVEGVEQSLSRPTSLLSLRIPGEDEYFAALDQAVAAMTSADPLSRQGPGDREAASQPQPGSTDAPSKEASAKAASALAAAAKRWDEITERLGRKAQQAAYRRSLGLDP